MRRFAGLVVVLLLAVVSVGAAHAASGPAGQQVTVSRSQGLDPAGTSVTVRGRGFDLNKGIYVTFCVNKGAGQMPSPCLGGVDMQGASGSSAWISSNPPSYGEGLAKPFTKVDGKGSFEVQLTLKAKDQFTNCLDKKTAPLGCVVGTRADHTRTADRSADVLIPVTFAGAGTTSTPPSTTPSTAKPSTGATTTGSNNNTAATVPEKKPTGKLASTGGLSTVFLVAALALLVVGAGLLIITRRRKTSKEKPA
ncbi:hypothetical protein [Kribbella sp. CA-293567]|uniref:hypothetical protein n=1 Tax=Kribbella sp. CA-293567 TaxID=3002436 RepID=UPI0022DD0276|nr:hypothetical protein [Kribbella sp. CA-293567]WBQ03989.1 hypothetical protein OX958_28980 [Kribbella sp. CA-293567]